MKVMLTGRTGTTRRRTSVLAFITIATLLIVPTTVFAQVSLGTAQSFAVLGGSEVTNTGASVISGSVGVSPGTATTGFGSAVIINGTIQSGVGSLAGQAQNDLTTAYTAAANTACTRNLTGQDLGTVGTLTPGVYCFDSSAQLTGTLTLDLQGNPNALFIFKTASSTLTTASGSSVVLINNGGNTCPPNIFWQVGSSATIGTGTSFVGNILAQAAITLTTGASLRGRALARTAAVTLDNNAITACGAIVPCPVITVNPATLPDGAVGSAYSATVSGSPAGTYTFTVTSGALPTGLAINMTSGAITGTPTAPGTFNYTITAMDSAGCLGSRAYSTIITGVVIPAAPGVPTLDFVGLAILSVLLVLAGLFVMNRLSL
jgi:hypothetical protein